MRRKLNESDTLLSPVDHPAGTRLLLARDSYEVRPRPYEVTILEWAPSGRRVRLQYVLGSTEWIECYHLTPIVVEVLNPQPSPGCNSLERGCVGCPG